MKLRSLLFVPADSEKKFAKAQESRADGLILDLEDAVAPDRKAIARDMLGNIIAARPDRNWSLWVRVNALDTGLTLSDLSAIVKPGLDGIMVPKSNGAADIQRIGHYLDALEVRAGMARGTVKIIVVATETPVAMFNLGSYSPPHERLAGLTWALRISARSSAPSRTSRATASGRRHTGSSVPCAFSRPPLPTSLGSTRYTPISRTRPDWQAVASLSAGRLHGTDRHSSGPGGYDQQVFFAIRCGSDAG